MVCGKITWIFGGTAVGKKRFISDLCKLSRIVGESYKPAWIEDGDIAIEDLVRDIGRCHLLVRWQWNREAVLKALLESHPEIKQRIILLQASPNVQAGRALQREGTSLWGEDELAGEAADVEALVDYLATTHWVTVIKVDCTKGWEVK